MQKLSSLVCALCVSVSAIAWAVPIQAQSMDKSPFPKKAIAQNNQVSNQADKQAIIRVYPFNVLLCRFYTIHIHFNFAIAK